jgi:putative OPT family oligopeptide transporter
MTKPNTDAKTLVEPFIPASKSLPEITIKGFILGVILSMVLAGSNAYLGLKMGQTISASIPAAVISMTVLRLFRTSNILENNIVQTIASAGEVIAAGIVFTIPALVIMGYWKHFHYWQITLIAIVGGILGVLFSIPLRRALIVEHDLKFPEGVATAEVLKAGEKSENDAEGEARGVKYLIGGALLSSLIKFAQSGLHVLSESVGAWFRVGSTVFGFNIGLSLSMVGAGFIVGMKVAINLILGTLIAWAITVPLYAFFSHGPQDFGLSPDASAMDFAMAIRSVKVRFIGVGTMIIGGIWTLVMLIGPIKSAIASSFEAIRHARSGVIAKPLRTDYDIPMTIVILGTLITCIPLAIMFNHALTHAGLPLSSSAYWSTIIYLVLAALIIGFICASIGGYMAGLVGSSSNPLSGITIGAILIIAFSLLAILSAEIQFGIASTETLSLAAVVIIIGAVVAVTASISCDNLQDLKSGQLVGSTPWKQQATLIVGVVAGGIVVAPILHLLFEAYGIGGVFPRTNMDPHLALSAPQATLMASVAQGIFEHKLDKFLVLLGVLIGLGIGIIDRLYMARHCPKYRLSILAIALGIYLPQDVVLPLVLGGLLNFFAENKLRKNHPELTDTQFRSVQEKLERRGLLFAAGTIAGEALVGIVLAIPFAAYRSTEILAIVGPSFAQTATILGTLIFAAICYYLYQLGHRSLSDS